VTRDRAASLTEIADVAGDLAQLRMAADDILRQAWSPAQTLALLDQPGPAFDERLWRTVRDVGWPDVLVSEAANGGGGTLRELAVLAEAAGAAAAPLPLASAAAAAWCEDRCVDGITLVLNEPLELNGETVSGSIPFVSFGAAATRILVMAVSAERAVLAIVDPLANGVTRELEHPLDHNPAATFTLDETPVALLAEGEEAVQRHRDARLRVLVGEVAQLVGIASAANAAATEYAKVRVAFGRPIGSFQAIKHNLVDQRSAIEVGRALVNRAADACQEGDPDAPALTSLAAFWAMEALRPVPERATQVFGGIAYTWEHEAHVHLRRAVVTAAGLGSRAEHRQAVTNWLAARDPGQR
jgi:alkylation response protein AidB-like acyl-CoA dehydrogenase